MCGGSRPRTCQSSPVQLPRCHWVPLGTTTPSRPAIIGQGCGPVRHLAAPRDAASASRFALRLAELGASAERVAVPRSKAPPRPRFLPPTPWPPLIFSRPLFLRRCAFVRAAPATARRHAMPAMPAPPGPGRFARLPAASRPCPQGCYEKSARPSFRCTGGGGGGCTPWQNRLPVGKPSLAAWRPGWRACLPATCPEADVRRPALRRGDPAGGGDAPPR